MNIRVQRSIIRAACLVLVGSIALAQSPGPIAQGAAAGRAVLLNPKVVASFECNSTHCFLVESITLDHKGNIYGSLSDWIGTCGVVKITPKGEQTMIAALPSNACALGIMLGVAFDEHNRLHVIFWSWGPDASTGVYRVEENGSLTLVFQLPTNIWPNIWPNGLAFRDGNIYVSDSTLGAIWRKAPGDSVIANAPWYQDAILAPPTPDYWGANGIAFYGNSLYISVSYASADGTTGSIVRLPIMKDGSPGTAEYFVPPDPDLRAVDGIAFDVLGGLWFATNSNPNTDPAIGGRVGVVGWDRKVRILWDDPAWLDYTSMVAFGTTFDTLGTLFVSNGGMLTGRPDVVSVFVGIPGLPLPAR